MKFRVERDEFAEAVAWTAAALPAKPTVPVLAGLRLEVSGHELALSGFDYEVSALTRVPVTASEGGNLLVSGRLLADIVRSLPAAPIDVEVDGTRAVITCGSSRFALPTLPVEDSPALPEPPAKSGTIASDVFAHAVAQVAIAAGRDDTLPVLTGIRVEVAGELLTLVATDRYRLAVRTLSWRPEPDIADMSVLIPARTLAEAAKTLAGAGAEVVLGLGTGAAGEGLAGFTAGARRTTTRVLDGEFPKYASLIPAEFTAEARVSCAALVESVKRVSLVASRSAPIKVTFGGDECVLEAGTGDEAQATEGLAASYAGEPLTIAFNPTYLLDGLGALESDEARLAFNGAAKPAVLTGKGSEGEYRYLLMPVRLNG